MRFAFLTCDRFPTLWEDDVLAQRELERRGHTVTPVLWKTATAQTLDAFDTVVMRNPWDWYHFRDEFRAFLAGPLRHTRARVVNDLATMNAFADKTYLARLSAAGFDVVPTVELTPDELASTLHRQLGERGWTRAVLKPAFTANAVGACVFDTDGAGVARALEASAQVTLAAGEKWLLQPFVPSIAHGEFSFIFFGGDFSHAVHKTPRSGDWRVQNDYGGTSVPFTPTTQQREEARALLRQAAPGTTYARVDAVEWNGRLHLMELEVVEPELFFRHQPSAPARFADVLLSERHTQR